MIFKIILVLLNNKDNIVIRNKGLAKEEKESNLEALVESIVLLSYSFFII